MMAKFQFMKKSRPAGMKKRLLSLAMALSLMLGMLPATALASGTEDSYVSYNGQNLYYDADGNNVGESGDWSVRLQKTAEATSNPNEFEITLTVETKDQIIETEEVVGADVVLVFDLSSSMDDYGKWDALKSAADTLLEKLLPAETKNQVAIVGYSIDEATIHGFSNNASVLKNSYQYDKTSQIRNKYDIWGTSTNCQGGFRAAEELLKSARDDALKYVVYMSDGEANCYYSDRWGNIVLNGGEVSSSYGMEAILAAQQQAAHLKETYPGTKIITVGLGTDENNLVLNPDAQERVLTCGRWHWHKDSCYTTYYGNAAVDEFHNGTTSTIESIYNSIATQIIMEANPWVVYDPMSSYVSLDSSDITSDSKNTVTTDQNGNRIVWDLISSTDSRNVYQYKYTVTLDQSNITVWGADKQNPTNNETLLVYKIVEKDAQGNVTESHNAVTVKFDVPKVTAIPYTITLEYYVDGVKKADATETVKALAGTEIDLTSASYQKSWPYTVFINRTMSTPDGSALTDTTYTIDSDTNGTTICYNYESGIPLTINYLEQGSNKVLSQQYTDVLKTGEEYSVASPEITGYELVNDADAIVENAMGSRPVTVNVYYKQIDYTVTYAFTGDFPDGVTAPVDSNSPYHYQDMVTILDEPAEQAGYTFHGWTLDGEAVSGSISMPAENITIYGAWSVNQYNLDVIYQFANEDDLNAYLEGKTAAGNEAVAAIEVPVRGDDESAEDFANRWTAYEAECDAARAEAETAYEGAFNAGTFHESYVAANGTTYTNVFVKEAAASHDYNYSYSFSAATVPNYKVTAATGTSGRLTADTTVIFTLANDLFQATVNHYKQVKESGTNTVTVDGKYYILTDSDASSLNSGDTYTVAEKSYVGFQGVSGNAEKLGEQTMPAHDVVVNLYYDAMTYKATFTVVSTENPEGYAEPADQTGLWYGDYVSNPNVSAVPGWTFSGWYTDEACTVPYNFSTPVTADVDLYGKWTQNAYHVTYHFVGDAPIAAPTDNTVYRYNQTIGSNAPDTSGYNTEYDTDAVDYTFEGWYTDASCSGTLYSFDTAITADVNLYGKWTNVTQAYTFTVEHYYEDAVDPFATTQQGAVDFGYQITDDAAASYKLGSDALASELGHNFAEFVSATGCTISADENTNVVKCYYQAMSFSLTINYVYQDQNPAATSYSASVKYGKGFNVQNPSVSNYHVESVTVQEPDGLTLTGGTSSVTGTMPGQDVTVKVVYAEDAKGTVTVNYLDKATNEPIAQSYTSGTVYVGDSYTVPSSVTTEKTVENYSYDSRDGGADTGTMTAGGVVINIYYTRDTYTVKVVHKDGADGAPNQDMLDAQNTETTYKMGEEYTYAPASNLPANYKQAGEPSIVGTPTKGGTVIVEYTYVPKGTATVTVNYVLVDEDGNVIRTIDSQVTPYKEDDSYNVEADIAAFETTYPQYNRKSIEGDALSGTLAKDDAKVITVKYTLNSYSFTVKYYKDSISDENELTVDPAVTAEAPYGTVLNEETVSLLLNDEGWLNAQRPSGYNRTSATYVTVGTDSAANVVKVLYTYESSPTPSYTYYTVTVNYLNQDTGEKIAQSYTDSIRSGRSYDVTAYDAIAIEGYTYVETTGDALTGTMNSDKVINVYYTADGTDIEDPDVPQGELPDDPGTDIEDPDVPQGELPTDLPDEDVPMADAPATGDTLMAWIAAAAVSGVGLVWLSIMGKKRKDENEG